MEVVIGHRIDVHYSGRFLDGTIFDETTPEAPLSFQVGQGHVISGFDQAVLGLRVGDKTTVTIPPENGYGVYEDDLVVVIPRDQFPKGSVFEIGQQFMLRSPEGIGEMSTVIAMNDNDVTLDLNHSMAGKTLVFDIEIADIKE